MLYNGEGGLYEEVEPYNTLWIAGPVEGSGDQFHQVRELVLPIG